MKTKKNNTAPTSRLSLYLQMKKDQTTDTWEKMKKYRGEYLFFLPFGLIFLLFYIVPVAISIFLSFTHYNVFEKPEFTGLQNYINLLVSDVAKEVDTINLLDKFSNKKRIRM